MPTTSSPGRGICPEGDPLSAIPVDFAPGVAVAPACDVACNPARRCPYEVSKQEGSAPHRLRSVNQCCCSAMTFAASGPERPRRSAYMVETRLSRPLSTAFPQMACSVTVSADVQSTAEPPCCEVWGAALSEGVRPGACAWGGAEGYGRFGLVAGKGCWPGICDPGGPVMAGARVSAYG